MRFRISHLVVYLLFATVSPFLFSGIDAPQNIGSRYLRNYTSREYDTQPQNWCILQDKMGRIYSANQGGLLEYDGVSWRHIFIPNVVLRALALGDDGNLYVGGVNEIGFFKPDANGSLSYVSLLDKLEESMRNFSYVFRCHAGREGIYFRTSTLLFRWNPTAGQMKTWPAPAPDSLFFGSFMCGDRLFIRVQNVGLMQMKGDALQLVPGGELFAQEGIFAMFPFDDRRVVIGTRSDGLFLYDGQHIVPFPTRVDAYLDEKKLSYGIRLTHSPGDFALATLAGGLVIMDKQGRVKELFTKDSGLQDENVKYVFEDVSGNLWLGLNEGISRIEYASPISIYDDRSNLPGIVISVTRHGPHNHLYVGTSSGLYYLPSHGNPGGFEPIPGISVGCRSLLSLGDSILAATDEGLFQLDTGSQKPALHKVIDSRTTVLLPSKREPLRIWTATSQGLSSLYQVGGGWAVERKFENINEETIAMAENERGELWLGTLGKGVIKINIPPGITPGTQWEPVVSRYDTSNGLPPGETRVFMAAGHMIVSTRTGIFRFDNQKQGFIPDDTFGKEFTEGSRYIFRMEEGENKNIWFISHEQIYHAIPKADGSFTLNKTPFSRLPLLQGNTIYLDPDANAAWFAREDGLIRYDTTLQKDYRMDYQALVRRVSNTNTQAVIYDGHPAPTPDRARTTLRFPVFAYQDRNIRFEYAAPFFEDESRTRYSYLLDGYDDHWSAWTSETRKDYTNLDAGTYTFRIRAKNVYEHISKEDLFRFKVLPPWYQTWWAYLIYAAGAFLFFTAAVKWRHRRLLKEKKQLEQTVRDRTREIADKNRQLETQSEQLKELDEAKSRFFANISHEFRTPLTLIMGPLEQILSRKPETQLKDLVHLMLRNARRLLNLVNQLLELARLDSGKMKLQAARQNIVPFVRSIVMCFESMADQNNIALTVHEEEKNMTLYFDGEKIEKIITNLLSNAFNHTPSGGRISVSLRKTGQTLRFPSGCVEIAVRDTGSGIPETHLPHIFDRFYRAEGRHEYKRKGSGIGLALTKELVELHHGEIEVTSDCREGDNRGMLFILRLPMGDTHLQPGEITDADEVKVISSQLPPVPEHAESAAEAEEEADNEEAAAGPGKPVETGTKEQEEKEEKALILVVDDNADVRVYIRGTLEPYFKVIEAADGKEGILRAKEVLPDLIVSDVMMPGTDGYQLCRTLKNDVLTSHIPIILLTARVSEESELEGLETGADDYITKPFSPAVLAVRVRNLIDLRRQLQLERKNRMAFQPEEIPVSPIDDQFYKTLQDTLETHLADPDFNVDALGRVLGMSQATLYRKIQALTGESPIRFIRSFRIKRAAQLLAARAGNVSEVALKVGFVDNSYFAKCFKEQFNRLPSDIHSPETEVLDRESFLPAPRAAGTYLHPTPRGPGKDIILVVEDSDDARGYIRESLESDYRVVEAAEGAEGIARAMEIIPDLIVSDVMMPGTDGYELCRVLKGDVRTSHIPVVLLTAKASEESKILGLETGADDYVTKPFSAAVLQARIRNLIRLRGHLQAGRNRELTLLPAKIKESELDKEFLRDLDTVIGKNLEDSEFNVDQLAGKLYMSSATLYRKVRALTGEVPSEYIRSFRLRRAAQLLRDNFGSVTQVAFEVGFTSRAYFTRCFKEKFHQLPSVYVASG